MTAPVTRLVFAVAAHLHMTAGAVRQSMTAHELMCWGYLFAAPSREQAPLVLTVEDEINAWE